MTFYRDQRIRRVTQHPQIPQIQRVKEDVRQHAIIGLLRQHAPLLILGGIAVVAIAKAPALISAYAAGYAKRKVAGKVAKEATKMAKKAVKKREDEADEGTQPGGPVGGNPEGVPGRRKIPRLNELKNELPLKKRVEIVKKKIKIKTPKVEEEKPEKTSPEVPKKTKNENKGGIKRILRDYNKNLKEGDKITYKSPRKGETEGIITKVHEYAFTIKNKAGETKKVPKTFVKKK